MKGHVGVIGRSAVFVVFFFLLPWVGLLLAAEMGLVSNVSGMGAGLVAVYLAFLVPVSRAYAHWVFLADIRRINQALARMRLGDYDVVFSVGEERPDEDEMIRLLRNMNWVARRIRADICTLSRHAQEMRSMSFRDALTGLGNRRGLEAVFHEAMCRGESIALALMDFDRFKAVNDTYGHLEGDAVLKIFGRILYEGVRSEVDYPFRLGGDEFGVIFRNTSLVDACDACRRIADRFASENVYKCTVSVGVISTRLGLASCLPDILSKCDRALYQAKTQGGNVVHGFDIGGE
jgi:diguanylate cyclase (GGDEF)-like protein